MRYVPLLALSIACGPAFEAGDYDATSGASGEAGGGAAGNAGTGGFLVGSGGFAPSGGTGGTPETGGSGGTGAASGAGGEAGLPPTGGAAGEAGAGGALAGAGGFEPTGGTGGTAGTGGSPETGGSAGTGGTLETGGSGGTGGGSCAAEEAIASLPDAFVWEGQYRGCTPTLNYLVQCQEDPCGTCLVTWGRAVFEGSTAVVPYSGRCEVLGWGTGACTAPLSEQNPCWIYADVTGSAEAGLVRDGAAWLIDDVALSGSWTVSGGCDYAPQLSAEVSALLNGYLTDTLLSATLTCD